MTRNFLDWLQEQDPSRRGVPTLSEVPDVLQAGQIQVVYQPLVALHTGTTFAYEALLRSTSPLYSSPPAVFSDAIRAGCCGALGRCVRQLSVQGCPAWPLFLNIHPNEFDEGWLVQPDDPIFWHDHPVYLEITESVPLSHFQLCHSVLKEVRSKGVFLAVDDLGAGYSNLRYITDLAPEIVKLDRGLICELDQDRRRQKLVSSLVRLCVDLGATVVAEGVERIEELSAVRDTGAHYGQGYLLARPSYPPPEHDQSVL